MKVEKQKTKEKSRYFTCITVNNHFYFNTCITIKVLVLNILCEIKPSTTTTTNEITY